MPAKVVDASVVAAMMFAEEREDEAESLIGDDDIYAPSLLRYELVSIARRKIVEEPTKRQEITDALHKALALDIHLVEVSYAEVLELALAHRLSTYDACYLFVARSLGFPLITFDGKLATASGGT